MGVLEEGFDGWAGLGRVGGEDEGFPEDGDKVVVPGTVDLNTVEEGALGEVVANEVHDLGQVEGLDMGRLKFHCCERVA